MTHGDRMLLVDQLFEIIMVFNAQAAPFVEGGNISPVGPCSVSLWAILCTP